MAYDIRLVKLITGDIVLGKYKAETNVLEDPAILQSVPTQQGGVQMMLMPFGYPFDQEMSGEVKYEHVLYEYKNCPEEMKNKYLEASSNLTLSAPGGLSKMDLTGKGGGGGISDLLKK